MTAYELVISLSVFPPERLGLNDAQTTKPNSRFFLDASSTGLLASTDKS